MVSQQDLQQEAKTLGEHLAQLLTVCSLPEEVKAGYMAMVPQMSLEQIDRLIVVLEVNAKAAAVASESSLGASLQATQEDYESAKQAAQNKAAAGFDEVDSILKQAQA